MWLCIGFTLLASLGLSNTVVQNDWSGQSGVAGPVTEWENNYSSSSGVSTLPGSIALACDFCSPWQSVIIATDVSGVYGVGTGDIDSDGKIDALLNEDSTLVWLRNPGPVLTEWEACCVDTAFYQAWSLNCSDIDNDGDMDIVGSQFLYAPDQPLVVWWENEDGAGNLWSRHLVDDSSSSSEIHCCDIDKDGDEDLVSSAGCWYEYLNDEVWLVHETGITSCPWFDVMDFDEDGDLDIIYGSGFWAGWAENVYGFGENWEEHDVYPVFDGFFYCVCAGDLDGDGDTDIASGEWEDYACWGRNPGVGGDVWDTFLLPRSSYWIWKMDTSDVNRDSFSDLVMLGEDGVEINVNSGEPVPSWTNLVLPGSYGLGFEVSDFNSNGVPDVLAAASGGLGWWVLSEYAFEGMLESSILQAGQVESWDWFSSDVSEVSSGTVGFQFRSSNDPSDMGAWSDTLFEISSSLEGILEDSTDFLQYRVLLQTSDPEFSPSVNQVEFTFSGVSSGVDPSTCCFELIPEANPMYESVILRVEVDVDSQLEFVLFDTAGRVVSSFSELLTAGTHSFNMGEVPSGLYFVSAATEGTRTCSRITVLSN